MPRQLPPLTTGRRPAAPAAFGEDLPDPVLDRRPAFLLAHPAGDEDDRPRLAVVDEVLHDVGALVGAEGQDEEVDRPGNVGDRGDRAAALDRSEARLDHDHVRRREPGLEDVVQDDVADVHLLRDADDADRRRLEQPADGFDRPGGRRRLAPGEPADAVQGNEPAAADDEGIDLGLFEDERGRRREGRKRDGQVAEAEKRRGQRRRRDEGLAAPERGGQLAEEGERLEELERPGFVEEVGGGDAHGPPLLETRVHVFDVEAPRSHGQHRPEIRGIPEAQEDLRTESDVVEGDLLHDEEAADRSPDGLPVGGPGAGDDRPQHGRAGRLHRGRFGPDDRDAADVGLVDDERRDDLDDDLVRLQGRQVLARDRPVRRQDQMAGRRRCPPPSGPRRPRARAGSSGRPSPLLRGCGGSSSRRSS